MRTTILILLSIISFTLIAGNGKVDKAQGAKAKAWVKNQQLEFIENKGQFTNTEGKPADNVLFKACYGSCDIYITDKGLSYVFIKFEEDKAIGNRQKAIGGKEDKAFGEREEEENQIPLYYRLDMDLVGAHIDKNNIIKEEESTQGYYNYIYPHCPKGIYNVKGYGKITIKNIYKGIDWVIYTNPNNKEHPLKYDFVVHPEANYKDIKIKYLNADNTSLLDKDSKLKIQTIAGNIEEGNIYSYQNNKEQEISSKYILNDNDSSISFNINAYDNTQTLIIDPLVWATYYGGTNHDGFRGVYTDSSYNLYVSGYTFSTDFPTLQLIGAYWQPLNGGGTTDAMILKFSSTGVRLWSTYFGGNAYDQCEAMTVDSQDNVFVTGFTSSSNLPIQLLAGAYSQTTFGGGSDAFMIKLNSQGVLLWSTFVGGTLNDQPNSICIDNTDNIYITGTTNSTNFPTQQLTGAYWQSALGGSNDVFILKFTHQGVLLWSTYYGGSLNDQGTSICVDHQNNIYITGYTQSTNFPTQQLTGAYWQSALAGGYDFFILKFNSLGVRLWSTYYGGSLAEQSSSVCIDRLDNLYLYGSTNSTNFPTQQLTGAYWQSALAGSYDFIIAKFTNQGVRLWSTYYGGNGNEGFFANAFNYICTDTLNNLYITGQTTSTNFPTKQLLNEYWQPSLLGSTDAILTVFCNTGFKLWSTYYGTSGNDFGTGITVDKRNIAYYIGEVVAASAYTVNPGNGAYYDSTWNGLDDSYILKLNTPCGSIKTTALQSNRNNICVNENTTITLTAIGGSGDALKWYKGACGQTYVGTNTPLTIPKPATTTTYYARWESACDTSACDSITINIVSVIRDTLYPNICTNQSVHVGTHTYTTTGVYKDTLISAAGCDSIIVTHLTINAPLINVITPQLCLGQSLTIGTHTYTTTGNYIDTLTTVAGCDSIVKTYITVYNAPQVNLGPDTTLCYWQTYILNATHPGATYLWQNGATTPTFYVNSISGTYWVKVTYGNNCYATDTVNVSFTNNIPKFTMDTILCPGQTLTLNVATPGGTYLWQDGSTSPTFFINSAGTYYVKTNISSYCYRTDTIHVHYTTLPSVHLGNDTTLCYWQYLILSASNPDCNYIWNDGSTFSNHYVNQAGTYWATAYVNSGCKSSDTIVVTFKPSPMVNLGPDTLLCNGQTLTLNAGYPYCTFLWQNGSTNSIFNITSQGTYWVKVSVNAGCFYADTIHVSYIPPPTVNLGNDTNLCQGQPFILNATSTNAHYLWQNGSTLPTYTVTSTGTYWVKVWVNSGCYARDTIHVTYNNIVNIGPDTTLCYGQTLTLNATYSNATYLWQDGSIGATFTVGPPYTPYVFWVKVTTPGCIGYDTLNVSYYNPPQIDLGPDTTLCQGQTIVLDATTASSTYVWQNGSTNATFNVIQQGTYWVKVTNNTNCSASDTVKVIYIPNPTVNLGNDTSLCPGETMVLNASFPNATYFWQDSTTNATYHVSHQGTYSVIVALNNYCFADDSIHIIYNANPIVSLGTITALCPGASVLLNATIPNGIYLWQDNSTAPTYNATVAGSYHVMVTDTTTQCSATTSITLKCDLEPIIPNIFTPNGDGFNDVFFIKNIDDWNIEVKIYDRWGLVVYESNVYPNNWDGKHNGANVADGTYYYVAKATNKNDGRVLNYHGSLTVLR